MSLRRISLVAAALLVGAGAAQAQNFPSGPITLVSPITTGGTSDIGARIYAQIVSESIGQPVVLQNKPGGGGVLGSLQVKEAKPDGHTLLLANIGSHAILQNISKLTYDPVEDFEPVALIFSAPNVLSVPVGINVSSVAELKKLASVKTGGLAYGSQGVGSGGQLLGAMLQSSFGVPMQHVAYRGGAPLTVDLVAGRVDISFGSYFSIKQHVADGKVRMLALTSPRRWSRLPDLPTMAEAGAPGIEMDTWYGVVAPKGTPAAVVERLYAEFLKASRNPTLVQKLDEIDVQTNVLSPAEFKKFLNSESVRLGKVAREHNVRVD